MSIQFDAAYDGGNIEVLRVDGAQAELAIRPDAPGPWFQWFDFKVLGGAGQDVVLSITNAGQSSYADGWDGYRARVNEGDGWVCAETAYGDGVLTIRRRLKADEARFAYFTPHDGAAHAALVRRIVAAGAQHQTLGQSVEGRAIDCLSLGDGEAQVWLVARQHCGETMGSWWMEGALDRLIDPADAVAVELRRRARIHVVPLSNPDGAARGHLRGNAAGLDLNRQWHGPDPQTAPEVAAILAGMDKTGVALCLDVHGDESIPHVFIDAMDAEAGASARALGGVARFTEALLALNPAFQTRIGYPRTYGGEGAPGMCARAVCTRFDAAAMTLEMPFKDSLDHPDPVHGWSAESSARMGHDCVEAVLAALEGL